MGNTIANRHDIGQLEETVFSAVILRYAFATDGCEEEPCHDAPATIVFAYHHRQPFWDRDRDDIRYDVYISNGEGRAPYVEQSRSFNGALDALRIKGWSESHAIELVQRATLKVENPFNCQPVTCAHQ